MRVSTSNPRRLRLGAALGAALLVALSACGGGSAANGAADSQTEPNAAPPAGATLTIGAIPDQDPEKLQRIYGELSGYLSERLGVAVKYQPVTDYSATVTSFRRGDLDAVFFGGLSGVQARLQVPGSVLLAQRDVDEAFQSVFVAGVGEGIAPIAEVGGLKELRGTSMTFGSEASTSGRLMPQYFLAEAGVVSGDLDGAPGFSGSHDATIKLVEAGTYQVGALNSKVWDARVAEGAVDQTKVVEIFRTPGYHDYHWLGAPTLDEEFGAGFTDKLRMALLDLDGSEAREADILALFNAGSFVPTAAQNYAQIETVARRLGLIS
ncbi:MAG: putative selenate ABC transporter substrate-binding protein [Sporichthyaceae bacterium]